MSSQTILISVYSRPVDHDAYPAGLANAVHLAYQGSDGKRQPLNRNYGVLFPRGYISDEDTIVPLGVILPSIFAMEDGYIGILGHLVYESGEPAPRPEGDCFLWKTRDLIRFEEIGPVDGSDYPAADTLAVDEAVAEAAIVYWSPIRQEKVILPEEVTVNGPSDLERVSAEVVYSDGSRAVKTVRWDIGSVDFSVPGVQEISGTIRRQAFPFPLARGYGDPVIFRWEGKWHFLGTNDNLDDIGLYIRESDTVEGLFAPGIKEHLILPFDPARGFEQTFWAPEWHLIGGEAYILFAVSGHTWGPQCHMMRLKKGGSVISAEDWESPVPVERMDGSPLASDGITLDMTFIRAESGSYVTWSYRRHIGTPKDTGSMLYIATVDEKRPWRLTCEPVLLTRPLYGWENVDGTINNEGPHALVKDGRVYLAYSGGSANAYTYALGLMTASSADDLTRLSSWEKSIPPVLSFYSVKGQYGPGHHSFYRNEWGEWMIAYHGETGLHEHLRCDGIRRVHFRSDGTPYLQMSADEDLPEAARSVRLRVRVRNSD